MLVPCGEETHWQGTRLCGPDKHVKCANAELVGQGGGLLVWGGLVVSMSTTSWTRVHTGHEFRSHGQSSHGYIQHIAVMAAIQRAPVEVRIGPVRQAGSSTAAVLGRAGTADRVDGVGRHQLKTSLMQQDDVLRRGRPSPAPFFTEGVVHSSISQRKQHRTIREIEKELPPREIEKELPPRTPVWPGGEERMRPPQTHVLPPPAAEGLGLRDRPHGGEDLAALPLRVYREDLDLVTEDHVEPKKHISQGRRTADKNQRTEDVLSASEVQCLTAAVVIGLLGGWVAVRVVREGRTK